MGFFFGLIIANLVVLTIAILLSIEKNNTVKSSKFEKLKTANNANIIGALKYNFIFTTLFVLFIIGVFAKTVFPKHESTGQTISTASESIRPVLTSTEIAQNKQLIHNNIIKLGNTYHWSGIRDDDEIMPVVKALEVGCVNDFCKIQKYFDYVKSIPYEKGIQDQDKDAVQVMKQWKGDCDERSGLLASIMKKSGYKTLLIYCKTDNPKEGHVFAALNIPGYQYHPSDKVSYFIYNNEVYYWAETTDPNANIGNYNGIDAKDITYIYSVHDNAELPLNNVSANIYL